MESLLKSLNNIPAMTPGVYSRFSIVLYQLVKSYYPEIDAQIISTKEGIAVLSINSFIINPYLGIHLDYTGTDYKERIDYFLEKEIPKDETVFAFIKNLSKLLEGITKVVPLTIENAAHRQSIKHQAGIAVDIFPTKEYTVHSRNGTWKHIWSHRNKMFSTLPCLVEGSKTPLVLETKYYYPRNMHLQYGVKLAWCHPDLEIEIIDDVDDDRMLYTTSAAGAAGAGGAAGIDEWSPTEHFVQGEKKSGMYKPMCNTQVVEKYKDDDLAAGGLFTYELPQKLIRYRIFARGRNPVCIKPSTLLFTMALIIEDSTVHKMGEHEEEYIEIPIQK